jgi:glycerol uptake facilitator protein
VEKMMNAYLAEFLGTTILVLLGNGVVCNVLLAKTKGNNAGWIVIAAGWAMAVYIGASIANAASGAHLNPALSIAAGAIGRLSLGETIGYVTAQFLGGAVGATLAYLFYQRHFQESESSDDKLACFCCAPNLPGRLQALFCEAVGTFVLIFTILQFQSPSLGGLGPETTPKVELGALGLVPVAMLVFGIGLCLGGTTGYAINPARDLSPRIVHFLLPIPGKRDSDWGYAVVPVLGPILGGLLAAMVFVFCQSKA